MKHKALKIAAQCVQSSLQSRAKIYPRKKASSVRKNCLAVTRVIVDSPQDRPKSNNDYNSLDFDEAPEEEEKINRTSYPVLICELKEPLRMKTIGKIEITPWTVNKKELREKFKCVFGRNDVHPSNDYCFDDDKIAPHQFEIQFCPQQKKFLVRDLEKSTGIFVRIIKSIEIEKETIVSFCNNHLSVKVTQLVAEQILEIKFINGLKKSDPP